jgi:PAS domain S-box-containing protein
MVLLDREGRCVRVNPALARLSSRSPETLLGLPLDSLFIEADRGVLGAMIAQTFKSRSSPTRRELRVLRPTGEVVTGGVSMSAIGETDDLLISVIRDISLERRAQALSGVIADVRAELSEPLGEARALAGRLLERCGGHDEVDTLHGLTARLDLLHSLLDARIGDIGARVQAEEALRSSEQRLRSVVEHVLGPLLVLDDRGRIVDANGSACTTLGWPYGELMGQAMSDVVLDVAADEVPRWMQLSVAASRRPAPEIDLPHAVRRLRCRDGRTVPVELRWMVMDWNGPGRLVVIARDVTEAHNLEQRLVRERDDLEERVQERTAELRHALEAAQSATRAKTQFLANMSHEIRTPLNAVLGLADLALRQPLDPTVARTLRRIQGAAQGLTGLLSDILDLAKVEAGRLEVEQVPLELAATLEGAVETLSLRAADKGLALKLELDPSLPPWIVGDPLRLSQVVRNLVSNAVKFTDRGGVKVTARQGRWRGQDSLELAVVDSGVGIPRQAQAQLFTPFTQVDATTTRRHGGTGLGLSICKQLTELMGGAIALESEVGLGTTVRIWLPLVKGAAPPTTTEPTGAAPGSAVMSSAPAPAPLPAELMSGPPTGAHAIIRAPMARFGGLRVLVVDDNEINREIAVEMLRLLGVAASTAETGAEALERAEEALSTRPYDLILMDIQMPVLDGIAATRALRRSEQARLRSVPVVAMTAHAMTGDRERSIEAGMNDHLTKPLELTTIEALLVRLYGGPAPMAASLFDQEAALQRVGGSRTLLVRLLKQFLVHHAGAGAELGRLVASDMDQAGLLAHSLKGSAASLGLRAIADASSTLTHSCRAGRVAPEEVMAFVRAFVVTVPVVEEWLGGVGG